MAKKKAPAKKKGSSSNSEEGSNSGIILVVVMIVVIGAAWYLKNGVTLPEFLQNSQTELATAEDEKPARETSQPVLRKDRKKDDTPQKTAEPRTEPAKTNTPAASETRKEAQKEEARREALKVAEEPTDYNKYYYTTSFDFTWPAYSQDDAIVEHDGFTLAYNEEAEQAKWVAYRLTSSNLAQNLARRKDNYRPDSYVATGSADPDDYRNSGYDRGHLAPAADFKWSQNAMDATFVMSNISPQRPEFNGGIWNDLEQKIRTWAKRDKELFIVTGPIIDKRPKRIGKNKVAVPDRFYKVVLDLSEPEVKAIGFILKNEASKKSFMDFAVSLDVVEKETGLDFFPMIPDELESKLESSVNKALWK